MILIGQTMFWKRYLCLKNWALVWARYFSLFTKAAVHLQKECHYSISNVNLRLYCCKNTRMNLMNSFLNRSGKKVTNKACITKEELLIPNPSGTLHRHENQDGILLLEQPWRALTSGNWLLPRMNPIPSGTLEGSMFHLATFLRCKLVRH